MKANVEVDINVEQIQQIAENVVEKNTKKIVKESIEEIIKNKVNKTVNDGHLDPLLEEYMEDVFGKVYVNQIDVTDQMIGNQLVFSDIQENKDIFVVYQQSSASVKALEKNTTFSISNSSEGFIVSGVPIGKSIAVYDLNGMMVMRQSSIGENHFALRKGFYIVSANGMSKKVSL